MAQRNEARKRRQAAKAEQSNDKRPKLQEQFADVKRQLATLTDSEWMSIPEPGDLSRRNKRVNTRADRFTPVPDSIVANAMAATRTANTIDPALEGIATPMGGSDLTSLGQARNKLLGIQLDQASDSMTGQTHVDPKGYITDINSLKLSSDAELSDIRRARVLLRSVITTNPSHPPGWISSARIEETAGKLSEARKLIMKGVEACPTSEDVWMEAARLHPPAAARSILARAVRALPTSVKIWMQAAQLETTEANRKAVFRRALEFIPGSLRIWKAAVELEEPDDARILLSRAVECVPDSTELWPALARLETYEQARKVLNRARKAVPTDPAIWITAAQLEEANGSHERIDAIITRAIKSLAAQKVVIDREQWLHEAEASERAQSPLTCQAIVRAAVGIGVEAQDRRATWLADVKAKLDAGSVVTARAIMAQLLSVFPTKKMLWWEAAQLEKAHGDHESLMAVLRRAVEHCPDAEVMWLMSAKELWLAGHVDTAREVLTKAFEANLNSEEIWLAAVKTESEVGENERARKQLQRARERAHTARVWMKSAEFERRLGARDAERELLREALREFPTFWKMHLMAGAEPQRLFAQG